MKITKLEALIVWNGLRSIPPKEFKTMEEIKAADDIITSFYELGKPLTENVKNSESELSDIDSQEEKKEYVEELNEKSAKLEEKEGDQEVLIEFEDESYYSLMKKFYERWGKYWFSDVHSLIAFGKKIGYNKSEKGQ